MRIYELLDLLARWAPVLPFHKNFVKSRLYMIDGHTQDLDLRLLRLRYLG